MTAYQVRIAGCDEVTTFVMDLDDAGAALMERAAALSREHSEYSCMPAMTITPCSDPEGSPL